MCPDRSASDAMLTSTTLQKPRHEQLDLGTLVGNEVDDDELEALRTHVKAVCKTSHPLRTGDDSNDWGWDDNDEERDDSDLAALKDACKSMRVVSRAKVTKERIYSMAYHPERVRDDSMPSRSPKLDVDIISDRPKTSYFTARSKVDWVFGMRVQKLRQNTTRMETSLRAMKAVVAGLSNYTGPPTASHRLATSNLTRSTRTRSLRPRTTARYDSGASRLGCRASCSRLTARSSQASTSCQQAMKYGCPITMEA